MNRKHTQEEYLSVIKNLLKARPDITFSSDFIVGYPGETEEDFQETISLIKKLILLIHSHSFIMLDLEHQPQIFKKLTTKFKKNDL